MSEGRAVLISVCCWDLAVGNSADNTCCWEEVTKRDTSLETRYLVTPQNKFTIKLLLCLVNNIFTNYSFVYLNFNKILAIILSCYKKIFLLFSYHQIIYSKFLQTYLKFYKTICL